MLATPEIDYYAEKTRENWRKYCERHGYGFHCGRQRIFKDMHVVWSKVGLLQGQLEQSKADWVVLVDADTIVNRPDFTLPQLTMKYPGKCVLISEDCSRRFGIAFPLSLKGLLTMRTFRPANTGFVAVQNNAQGRAIVSSWVDLAHMEFASIADKFPREQMVFWAGVYRDYRRHIAVLGSEVVRVGFHKFWDRLTIRRKNAFVLHDKSLLEWSGSA